jgi:putative nucleotidyltransferase with HDIG domain
MKLINSAYYGLNSKVTSLVRAIIMLGINTVKNLALSTAVLGNISSSSFQSLDLSGFWRHSLCVGVTARMIAKEIGISSQEIESYFIAGLLHDIGKIPLNNALAEMYIHAMSHSEHQGIPLVDSERHIFGFSHEEVGKLIAKSWKLGPEIYDALSFHHRPESYSGDYGQIVRAVAVSNYFANEFEFGFSGNRNPLPPQEEVFGELGISREWLEDLEEEVTAEIEKAKIFLKITD